MTRGEILDRIMADFDSLDYDISLWTTTRTEEYNKAVDKLKGEVVSLILSTTEYEKYEVI